MTPVARPCRSLTDKFPQQVTALSSGYVGGMLQEFAANPESRWKAKDGALYLVTALTIRGKTMASPEPTFLGDLHVCS